jgi:glycosyltransferase involved in cell wall biosynthesis
MTTDLGEAASAARHTRISPSGGLISRDVEVQMFRAQPPRRIAFSRPLARALRETVDEYDVVHIHSLFMFPQYVAYREASGGGVPFIVSPCGALDPFLRRRSRVAKAVTDFLWQSAMLRDATAIHFKTEDERALTSDLHLAKRQFVVPNGISWSTFQALEGGETFRRRYLRGHEGPVILNTGRFSHKKGLDTLIRAFALIRHAHPEVVLALVGPDDEGLGIRLAQLAADQGVLNSVAFIGILRGEDLRAALSAATVWALPSKTENFGSAVIEAMAAGVPVVISREVNVASDIDRSNAGVVCPRTPQAFAAAIGSLLDCEMRRVALSRNARRFAQRYDWHAIAPQLLEMYAATTRAHQPSPESVTYPSTVAGAGG